MQPEKGENLLNVYSRELKQNINLRRNTSDLEVVLKILESHEYAVSVGVEPALIIDAGANIGISTLYFAKRFPKAKIHAIEPDAGNYRLLKSNCEGTKNVITHKAALWPHHASLNVIDPHAEKWMFSFQEGQDGDTTAITLFDVLEQAQVDVVDLLKLDIEGGEKILFENGSEKWLCSVRTIIIELHDRYVPGCSNAFYRAIGKRKFSQEQSGENVVVRFHE